jgi:chromosomal replication initiator protein
MDLLTEAVDRQPAAALWDQVKERLRAQVSEQAFSAWFAPTRQERFVDGTLVVSVPSKMFRDRLTEDFQQLIQETASGVAGRECTVVFLPEERKVTAERADEDRARQIPLPEVRPLYHGGTLLNKKYRFDTFVVGSSNQMAHAASLAVAEGHSKTYNPLFLYGGTGLGKTHLLHAIGLRFLDSNPGARVVYISAETFVNELINSIRYERMPSFRSRYRNIDLLLIDDIQFIAGKEKTQEEFFHTFNSIHESHKQIVLTSDKVPRDIPDLEERLRSRFEWGLIADIQMPDLETKVAILRKKAEQNAIGLPNDVALFMANSIKSNIRELEGSLIRLGAYASLGNREITVDFARETLKDLLLGVERTITIDEIKRETAAYFGIKVADLVSKSRSQNLVYPRQISMYICRQLTSSSLPVIGKMFGGRDHSTVIHSIKLVAEKLKTSVEIQNTVETIVRRVQG